MPSRDTQRTGITTLIDVVGFDGTRTKSRNGGWTHHLTLKLACGCEISRRGSNNLTPTRAHCPRHPGGVLPEQVRPRVQRPA